MFRHQGDPATRVLVATNVAIFALQWLARAHYGPWIEETFGLTRGGLAAGAVWQLVTYQFLHANELHILMNMLGLWFAGRELERVVGTGRFVALYLAGGVVAGLAQTTFSPDDMPLVGASGSVCAVLLALTTLFPNLQVTALIFFVLPLRMRARTLGIGLVGLSTVFWLLGWPPEVGHLAHLGGFAAGWAFGLAYRKTYGNGGGAFELPRWAGAGRVPPLPPDPRPPRDVSFLRPLPSLDEILAKVLDHGIESLTREERQILEEARRPRRR